jgi:hypothetical protein
VIFEIKFSLNPDFSALYSSLNQDCINHPFGAPTLGLCQGFTTLPKPITYPATHSTYGQTPGLCEDGRVPLRFHRA